jgi:hypothetical protein
MVLAAYIGCQSVRTAEWRKQIGQAGNIDTSAHDDYVLDDNMLRLLHMDIVGDFTTKIAEILLEKRWALLYNLTRQSLWTSDNPVNRFPGLPSGQIGLQSPGVQIHFPLTPRLAILLCDQNTPNIDQFLREESVRAMNRLQCYQSTRFVFAADGTFDLARQVIKEAPEIARADRPRFIRQPGA